MFIVIAVGCTVYTNEFAAQSGVYRSTLVVVTGQVSLMNFWLAIIPTAKTSFFTYMTNVPYERATKYHRLIVLIAMIGGLVHLLFNYRQNREIFFTTQRNSVHGLVAYILASIMCVFALEGFRKLWFELFMTFHQLYIIVIVFLILHTHDALPGFVPGIILHGIDLVVKLYSSINAKNVSKAKAEHGITAIYIPVFTNEISLGSYCFVNIPAIATYEWHPFSISGYDKVNKLISFHIKSLENESFTHKLYRYVSTSSEETIKSQMKVAVVGPYGFLSLNISQYTHVCLIAGGIGITPMLPILDEVISNANSGRFSDNPYKRIKKICLVWSVRGTKLVKVLLDRLTAHLNPSNHCEDVLPESLRSYSTVYSPINTVESRARNSDGSNIEMKVINEKQMSYNPSDRNEVQQSLLYADYNVFNTSKGSDDTECSFDCVDDRVSSSFDTNLNKSFASSQEECKLINNVLFTVNKQSGRPPITDIIQNVIFQAKSNRHVAVILCGPLTLVEDVVEICRTMNIDYHVEAFSNTI